MIGSRWRSVQIPVNMTRIRKNGGGEMVRRNVIPVLAAVAVVATATSGCNKTASTASTERQEIPQIDPTTYIYNGQTYAVVHRPVADRIYDVEVSGVAQAMTASPTDGQIAMNAGAQFLAQRGLCGGTTVPALMPGSQSFDPTHEYWKQQFRCP